jgi:hypothetical protein
MARLSSLPGVAEVSEASSTPFVNSHSLMDVQPEGFQVPPGGPRPVVESRAIYANYFRVLGTPIVEGRPFSDAEMTGNASVMIVESDLQIIRKRPLSNDTYYPRLQIESIKGNALATNCHKPVAQGIISSDAGYLRRDRHALHDGRPLGQDSVPRTPPAMGHAVYGYQLPPPPRYIAASTIPLFDADRIRPSDRRRRRNVWKPGYRWIANVRPQVLVRRSQIAHSGRIGVLAVHPDGWGHPFSDVV